MKKQTLLIPTIIIFILSATSMALWLTEIVKIKGWYGLDWLNGTLYSPYISTLITVFAFMTPFITSKQVSIKKSIVPTTVLYGFSIFSFEAGKRLCYLLYCRFCFWTSKDIILLFSMAFILFVFFGIAYWFVTNTWIRKNKKINILFITLLALSTIPISLLTIQINKGFGAQTDWIDTVKMGYPIFWMSMALGISAIMITRQKPL